MNMYMYVHAYPIIPHQKMYEQKLQEYMPLTFDLFLICYNKHEKVIEQFDQKTYIQVQISNMKSTIFFRMSLQ